MAKKILVIAPHNDDETIGVGATIAKHIASGDEVFVATVRYKYLDNIVKSTLKQTKKVKSYGLSFLDKL